MPPCRGLRDLPNGYPLPLPVLNGLNHPLCRPIALASVGDEPVCCNSALTPARCGNVAVVAAPPPYCGGVSRASALICLNSGLPATSHHSNNAASVVVSVAPADSMRRSAIRQSTSCRDPTASAAT